MTATAKPSNYGLILFPNMLNSARLLAPKDSDPDILLKALGDLRFNGDDPDEIRGSLADYNLIAFNLLSEKLIRRMHSYKEKCDQHSDTHASDTNVIGGGMYLDDDDLRMLAYATEGTEAENYFYGLYQVHSGEADADTVENALPRGAKMVFRETRTPLFGETPKKLSRSEINRKNAQRGWAKRKAAKETAAQSSVPESLSLPPEASEISLVPDETEIIQSDSAAEPVLSAELPEKNETSEPAATNPEEILLPVSDTAEHPDAEDSAGRAPIASSYGNANDANACKQDAKFGSHFSTINKDKEKYKYGEISLPPYPPHDSHASEGKDCPGEECKDLRAKFEELYEAYPKHEEPGRAWGTFLRLNPDERLMEEIFMGLKTAKKEDRRFCSEYRYIPLLCNWISAQGWKSENMQHIADPAAVRHPDQSRTSLYMYGQRPMPTQEFIERRCIAAIQELKKRYG